MKIQYLIAITAAVLLSACSGPSRVEKVCTGNQKTQKTVNGNELRPDVEPKTVVLTLDEKYKSVRFDSTFFDDSETTFTKESVLAHKEWDRIDPPVKSKSERSFRYHVGTGVVDFTDKFSFVQMQSRHSEILTISFNGTCK